MASLRTVACLTLALSGSPAIAGSCGTPILGALAHEPHGDFIIRNATPASIKAQCGSVVDTCVIHQGAADFVILIRNDLSATEYECALLRQYAEINAKQI